MKENTMNTSLAEARLWRIFRVMNGKTFGLRFSEKIVGGRARLDRLIIEGKVKAQNGKWLINAADVLRYARPKD